jgi:hypothetical protein
LVGVFHKNSWIETRNLGNSTPRGNAEYFANACHRKRAEYKKGHRAQPDDPFLKVETLWSDQSLLVNDKKMRRIYQNNSATLAKSESEAATA